MSSISIVILCTILAYMCLLIGVGIYNAKKNNSSEDFYLGGRKMGALVVAMSAEASDMSSWLLMGLPGHPVAALTVFRQVWQSVHI